MIDTNYKPLVAHIQKICDVNNVRLYTDYNRELFQNEKKEKPYVVFQIKSSGTIEEQEGMDLKNECKGGVRFNIVIEAEEIDDIIRLEECIPQSINNSAVNYPRMNGETLEAIISFVADQPSERKAIDVEGGTGKHYQSIHCFRCMGMIFPKIVEHPVQIELDRKKQLNALLRLSFVEDVYNDLKKRMNTLFSVVDDEDFSTVEEKFIGLLQDDDFKEQYLQLYKQLQDIQCQCDAMYNFENVCKEKITMDDEGFRFCYLEMITNSLDLMTATEKYKEKKKGKKEPEKLSYLRTIAQKMDNITNEEKTVLIIADNCQQILEELYIKESEKTWAIIEGSYEFNTEWSDYCVCNEQGNIQTKAFDYTTMMPVTFTARVILRSLHMDDLEFVMKKLEKSFGKLMPLAVNLSFIPENQLYIEGTLQELSSDKVVKGGADNKYFTSSFDIVFNHSVWTSDFDNKELSQIDSLKRLVSLCSIRDEIDDVRRKESTSEEDEEKLWERRMAITEYMHKELAKKIGIPRTFRLPVFYRRYYELLTQSDLKLEEATEIINDEEEKAKSKKILIEKEKMLQTKGDAMLNLLTDAILQDMQKRVSIPVEFWGGSTYQNWFLAADINKNMNIPNVLIKARSHYNIDSMEYHNVDAEGEPRKHPHTLSALPLVYSIMLRIYAETEEEVNKIKNQIKQVYSESEVQIKVPDPIEKGEYMVQRLAFEEDWDVGFEGEKKLESGQVVWVSTMVFAECEGVYYTDAFPQTAANNDTVYQLSLIHQAQFCREYEKALNEAIEKLDVDYKNLYDYGFLSNLFHSADYVELKNSIKKGDSVDIKLFNKVFEKITKYYPLFQRFAYNYSYEQIREEIVDIGNKYKEKCESLCERAGIPETISTHYKVDDETYRERYFEGRSSEALSAYSGYMLADIYFGTDKAIEKYCKKKSKEFEIEEKRRRQWEAEQQALAEMRAQEAEYESYDMYDSGGNSDGSGFASSLLSSSIANAGIKRELRKQTKLMREQAEREKERERMASQRERDERHRAAVESQRRFDAVMRANRERRRKGQPELPLPPRTWY